MSKSGLIGPHFIHLYPVDAVFVKDAELLDIIFPQTLKFPFFVSGFAR